MDTIKEVKQLRIRFDVIPKTDHRPRFTFGKGGKPFVYSNPKTKSYKDKLLHLLSQQLIAQDAQFLLECPLQHPIALTITFSMPIPQRLIRKGSKPWQSALPSGKPDIDNLTKAIQDVLTGNVYKDDAQVTHLLVRKIYDAEPYIQILVERALPETRDQLFNLDSI